MNAPDPAPAAVEWPVVITTESPAETKEVAARLARICASGDVVLLSGDLGAGKTAFAQGFAAALGVAGPVTSPTFALVRQYDCNGVDGVDTLIHADVYRTGSINEVLELALAELVEERAVAVVEWGEMAAPALSEDVLDVALVLPNPDAVSRRTISISGRGRWLLRADDVTRAVSAVRSRDAR